MSLSIGKPFHVVHVAEALAPLDAWYDEVFVPIRGFMDANFSPRDLRDGSLLGIGEELIETMAPAAVPGGDTQAVGRFFTRFGRHLHSLAWYTDDVGAIWDRLVERGIRVVSPMSADERPDWGDIYTHPKDTCTQLEFFQPTSDHPGPPDPRFAPDWPARWAASPNPLGISRMAYSTVVTNDPDRAASVFIEVLGADPLVTETSALTGTASLFVSLGPGSVVELAVPLDPASLAGRDLAACGDTCHAVAWLVDDLDAVAAHLGARGIGIAGRDDETLLAEPADTYGAALRFTTRRVPGDPRDRP